MFRNFKFSNYRKIFKRSIHTDNKKIIGTDQPCTCNNKCDDKIIYCLGFFTIGCICEIYTFHKTGDIYKSTGLGWSLVPILLIL